MFLRRGLMRAGLGSGGGVDDLPEVVHRENYYDSNGGSVITLTGAALPAGLLVVGVHAERGSTPPVLTGVTVGGVAMTEAVNISTDFGDGRVLAAIFYSEIAAGTYDIVASLSSSTRALLSVFLVTGHTSATPLATGSASAQGGTGLDVGLSSYGAGVAIHTRGTEGYDTTFVGLGDGNESYDADFSMSRFAGATVENFSAATVSATYGYSYQDNALAVAVWG